MAYIPEKHKKYNLLPMCKDDGEVFDYPSQLLEEVEAKINPEKTLIPYGYSSYVEYYSYLDLLINEYNFDKETKELLIKYKSEVEQMNCKEEWSILKYLGETEGVGMLTNGKNYYWPTQASDPVYRGVIDDEEFTTYLYPRDSNLWEILEDPTGMAKEVIDKTR